MRVAVERARVEHHAKVGHHRHRAQAGHVLRGAGVEALALHPLRSEHPPRGEVLDHLVQVRVRVRGRVRSRVRVRVRGRVGVGLGRAICRELISRTCYREI